MILTFGYGNRKNYNLLSSYIEDYNIKYLFDVRNKTKAWSRLWYGQEIANFCHKKGIKYANESSLGNTSGKSNWISPAPEKAEEALINIAKIASNENVLLLCAEMDFKRCHRCEVAERLNELANTSIRHLE